MEIRYSTEIDGNEKLIINTIDIDIDQDATIGELIAKFHEITGMPTYRELKWDDEVMKASYSYDFRFDNEEKRYEYIMIRDMDKKINEFYSDDVKEELVLWIETAVGFAN